MKPSTEDLNKIHIVKFDGVNVGTVYLGGLGSLEPISDKLHWHKIGYNEDECELLTLEEIYKQVAAMEHTHSIITVFQEAPLSGTIYQCGNYKDGQWVKYGTVMGYA